MRTSARRNPDHSDTSIFRFVSEEPEEFRPALIMDVFGQEAPTKPSHIQILNCDQAGLRNQPSAHMVTVIPSKVPAPFVLTSQQESGFLSAPRPFDAAGDAPLRYPKPPACGPVSAWTRDQLTGREGRKVRDPQVHAHGRHGGTIRRSRRGERQSKTDVPAADDAADRHGRYGPRPAVRDATSP